MITMMNSQLAVVFLLFGCMRSTSSTFLPRALYVSTGEKDVFISKREKLHLAMATRAPELGPSSTSPVSPQHIFTSALYRGYRSCCFGQQALVPSPGYLQPEILLSSR